MAAKRIIIIALGLVAVVVGYKFFAGSGGAGWPQGGPLPVSASEVIERDVHLWHEFSGRLMAVDQAELRPQVTGKIESIHFTNGATVNKGDLLFIIDPRPYEAALQAASARAVLAESELTRASSLLKDKAISQRDYDQRKNSASVARADLTRARLDLDYTRIKAPITGRTGRAEITVGNLVESGPNAPVLTTIVASTPIYADFEVDEDTYLQYAKSDMSQSAQQKIPVQLALDNGMTRDGFVDSFDNRLNTTSGTIRVRAIFGNDDGVLVPGLFARVKLGTAATQKALLITDRAIGTDQNKKFVMIVDAEGKAQRREIKLGERAEGLRIVTEGLNVGDKIIVSSLQRIMMPGMPVQPEMVAMDAPPPSPQGMAPPSDKPAEAAPAEATPAAGEPAAVAPEEKPAEAPPAAPEPEAAKE